MENTIYCVYKLKRSDGKIYIGTTGLYRLKQRMCSHKNSTRFKDHDFSYDIIFQSSDYDEVMDKEEYYIEFYDSFYNGLNESIDGKGNHLAANFTTKGYAHTEETKKKISKKAIGNKRGVGFRHTNEQKEKWSRDRKGKNYSQKLTNEQYDEIRNLYKEKPKLENAGKKSKNGRITSYDHAFAKHYANKFNVSHTCIRQIIQNKRLVL